MADFAFLYGRERLLVAEQEIVCGCLTCRQRREAPARPIHVIASGDMPSAVARAEGLLKEVLRKRQWKDYKDTASFCVRGSNGVIYRILPRPRYYNVASEAGFFCGYPKGYLCLPDQMLGQALMLKADAYHFLRIANHIRSDSTWGAGVTKGLEAVTFTDYGGKI